MRSTVITRRGKSLADFRGPHCSSPSLRCARKAGRLPPPWGYRSRRPRRSYEMTSTSGDVIVDIHGVCVVTRPCQQQLSRSSAIVSDSPSRFILTQCLSISIIRDREYRLSHFFSQCIRDATDLAKTIHDCSSNANTYNDIILL